MTTHRKVGTCACGKTAVWYKEPRGPEQAPEHAVCFLTDDDFADRYCDACFEAKCRAGEVSAEERPRWRRRTSG